MEESKPIIYPIPFTVAISKLLAIAAWIDGNLNPKECDIIDTFIKGSLDLTEEQKWEIGYFIVHPHSREEINQTIREAQELVVSEDQKKTVLNWLNMLISADGKITAAEAEFTARIMDDIHPMAA